MGLQSFLTSATSTSAGSWAVGLLLFVGGIEGLRALLRFASGIYTYYIRPGKNLKRLGQWAVVTGATDGIGRAYADGLAKKGR
jgi:17beta-estradiol 17-dehydrogenase / very-long-chain 3-oxoacyl-CoA reductase